MTDQPPAPPAAGNAPTGDGAPFGQYRLLELLGRGGMGEVWRAHDAVTDRIVALKLLPSHFAEDSVFKERFRREAHAAAQLNEPHVVPIHTYGEIDGRLFVDMRLIKGRDLQTVLADGPLPMARALLIIEQVAQALHAAHEVGLVHRDVKPSNILITDQDFAYLIDFGIARAAGETGLTATGGLIGSLHYMAPERFSTGQADARSDIYALACVLYESLTGGRPFPGDSLEQQLAGHLATPPPRPSSASPGVPAEFDSVIAKGMAKDPDQRYATTVELARAARDATTAPISAAPPTIREQVETQSAPRGSIPPLTQQPPPGSAATQRQQPPAAGPLAPTSPAWGPSQYPVRSAEPTRPASVKAGPGYPIQKRPASGRNKLALASLIASLIGLAGMITGVLIIWLAAAETGMILMRVGFICLLSGIVLGSIGLIQIKRTQQEGRPTAIAGIVIGVLGFPVALGFPFLIDLLT